MKKFLLITCFLLSTVSVLMAGTIGFINLRIGVQTDRRPIVVIPRTLTNDAFTAFQDLDEIVITSEDASGDVTVTIAGVNGVVYSTTETMSVGSELTISVSSLPVGAYTIYIYYANTVYVGQFEI